MNAARACDKRTCACFLISTFNYISFSKLNWPQIKCQMDTHKTVKKTFKCFAILADEPVNMHKHCTALHWTRRKNSQIRKKFLWSFNMKQKIIATEFRDFPAAKNHFSNYFPRFPFVAEFCGICQLILQIAGKGRASFFQWQPAIIMLE